MGKSTIGQIWLRSHWGVNTSVKSSSIVQCSPTDSKHQRVDTILVSTLVLSPDQTRARVDESSRESMRVIESWPNESES